VNKLGWIILGAGIFTILGLTVAIQLENFIRKFRDEWNSWETDDPVDTWNW
jgi:hypothetical protein